jgi:hypothetical protein
MAVHVYTIHTSDDTFYLLDRKQAIAEAREYRDDGDDRVSVWDNRLPDTLTPELALALLINDHWDKDRFEIWRNGSALPGSLRG